MNVRKIQKLILVFFYWEYLLMGAIPMRIINRRKVEVSRVFLGYCRLWTLLIICIFIIFLKWLILEFRDLDFRLKVIHWSMMNMYIYTIGTFLFVCLYSKIVAEKLNQIFKYIDPDLFANLISTEIIFEFFNISIIQILLEIYFLIYVGVSYVNGWKSLILSISFLPRRVVLVAVLMLMHFISETLKIVRQEIQKNSSYSVALSTIFEILTNINGFVQFAVNFNALLVIKNLYIVSWKLIITLTQSSGNSFNWSLFGRSDFHTIFYLPTEVTRLYTIIKCCTIIREEVILSREYSSRLMIFSC